MNDGEDRDPAREDQPRGEDPRGAGPDPARRGGSSPDPHQEGDPGPMTGRGSPPDDDRSGELDVDSAFAAIVANWSAENPAPGRWPAAEELDPPSPPVPPTPPTPPGPGSAGRRGSTEERAASPDVSADPLLPSAWPRAEEELDDSEGFVPPDPPPTPLLRGDLVFRLAWAGVLGGPLYILAVVILGARPSQVFLLMAVIAFVGGFVTLVARMPKEREDDDDDGAVV